MFKRVLDLQKYMYRAASPTATFSHILVPLVQHISTPPCFDFAGHDIIEKNAYTPMQYPPTSTPYSTRRISQARPSQLGKGQPKLRSTTYKHN